MDFALGWFADPIYLGRYPQCMTDMLGDRLPKFSDEEWKVIKDSSEVWLSSEVQWSAALTESKQFYGCNVSPCISLTSLKCLYSIL